MYRYNLEVTYDKRHGDQDINDAFSGKIWRPAGFCFRPIIFSFPFSTFFDVFKLKKYCYDDHIAFHSVYLELGYKNDDQLKTFLAGPTKDDTKLVFAYYDLSSQIVFHKISDNVHPAIMAFGIKYMAENIKDLIRKDENLADFVRNELAKNRNSPITTPMEEQPGSSEQGPGLSLNLKKGKRKGYKKVDREDTEV